MEKYHAGKSKNDLLSLVNFFNKEDNSIHDRFKNLSDNFVKNNINYFPKVSKILYFMYIYFILLFIIVIIIIIDYYYY